MSLEINLTVMCPARRMSVSFLFAMLLNELESKLLVNNINSIVSTYIALFLLLCADGTAIIVQSSNELQEVLKLLLH